MEATYSGFNTLVIVPGHAVYVGKEQAHTEQEEYWIGGFPGEAVFYAQHIRAGVQEAAMDASRLLIFSGGQTRARAGPLSEAQSYWFLSDQNGWFGHGEVRERATTEEFARDSFENLAFSIGRFKQCVGCEPQKIIVCSWEFKKERYEAHCLALGVGIERFIYIPVNDPQGSLDDPQSPYARSIAGERRTLELFRAYPFGNSGELLEKRLGRDPFKRGTPFSV